MPRSPQSASRPSRATQATVYDTRMDGIRNKERSSRKCANLLLLKKDNSSSPRSISIVQLNTLLCFKQAVARFSEGKTWERRSLRRICATTRRSLFAFCAIADWLKQKAKHLLKSTVMSPDAIGFLVAKQHKKCPIDFSMLALGNI